MNTPEQLLAKHVTAAVTELFGPVLEPSSVTFQKTNPQFEGDITLVVFPYTKLAGKSPEQTGQLIGEYLRKYVPEVASWNVVKGFLNIVISPYYWLSAFNELRLDENWGRKVAKQGSPFVMVEYSSPNTNKPLHLGHVRNILLGYSIAEIFKAAGNEVMKVNLVNDRGIHICKSMVAWKLAGEEETPESTGMKGDHLVGKYYVRYDQMYKMANRLFLRTIYDTLLPLHGMKLENGSAYSLFELPYFDKFINHESFDEQLEKNEDLKQNHRQWFELKIRQQILQYTASFPSGRARPYLDAALDKYGKLLEEHPATQAIEMLRKWEANDPEVRALWQKMNGWVYDGFAKTYAKLNVDFDKMYYESNTYLLGKEIVEEGLKKGVLQKRDDGAVIIDNSDSGLDVKVLLRSDGTSVYITQDLGTADERHKEFPFDKHIYVVGNEQDYHFKTLKVSLKKLGRAWADGLYHLSYGMVELPEGKMKSREGTVVDADDLFDAMEHDAREMANEKGLIEGMSKEEQDHLAHIVGMAALKYFILKVDPKKKMLFNPKESIDLQGNTGPFIQYTHARIRSIWRKSGLSVIPEFKTPEKIHPKEKELIKLLAAFPTFIHDAAKEYSPAVIANYTYDLAKTFNQFYDACDVLREEDADVKNFRLALCVTVARTIKSAFGLLGIEVPEKM